MNNMMEALSRTLIIFKRYSFLNALKIILHLLSYNTLGISYFLSVHNYSATVNVRSIGTIAMCPKRQRTIYYRNKDESEKKEVTFAVFVNCMVKKEGNSSCIKTFTHQSLVALHVVSVHNASC